MCSKAIIAGLSVAAVWSCSVFCQPAAAQPTGACVYTAKTFPFSPGCVNTTEESCASSTYLGRWLGPDYDCDYVAANHPYTYDLEPLYLPNAGQVNISGASLFVDFFGYPGTTNDCMNVDEDFLPCSPFNPFSGFINGECGIYGVDQLAPDWSSTWNGHWLVQYRSVGSGNGLAEFVDYQLLGTLPSSVPSERGLINRSRWAELGVKQSIVGGEANCFSWPNCADVNCDGAVDGLDVQAFVTALLQGTGGVCGDELYNRADYDEDGLVTFDDLPGFVQAVVDGSCPGRAIPSGQTTNESGTPVCPRSIDIANMDVATKWFVQTGSSETAAWDQPPTIPGYGYNPTPSATIGSGTMSNQLKNLKRGSLELNTNTESPDANTVFDTTLAFSPAGLIANRGAGIGGGTGHISYTDLQYLFVTGRLPSGENLTACTRDAGSGTRNLTMNSLGIDPSWGAGDNLGKRNDLDNNVRLGPGTQPTNCGGSGVMETAVQNRRLAVGYTGIFGSSRVEGDVPSGRYELLNLIKDIAGGTQPVRADVIDRMLDNGDVNTGYQIGGSQTLATVGDPEAEFSGKPGMASLAARDLLLNIKRSLENWVSNPPSLDYACPAGVLVQFFMPDAAVDFRPVLESPTDYTDDSVYNSAAQEAVRLASTYQGNPHGAGIPYLLPYGGVIPATGGKVPARISGTTYQDGSTNGAYQDSTGTYSISSSANVMGCMTIHGDWNGDGVRDADDIGVMMAAYWLKQNVSTWEFSKVMAELQVAPDGWAARYPALVACCPDLLTNPYVGIAGNYIVPELFGDYDGDGNFTAEDVRYFADGLALDPSTLKLDRALGFASVDNAWFCITGTDDNFFDTQVNGAYAAGDSRLDVAGDTLGPARGAMPRGADGFVNSTDVTYVTNNYFISGMAWGTKTNTGGLISNDYLGDHATKDLSCDMNNDFIVDATDVAAVSAKAQP